MFKDNSVQAVTVIKGLKNLKKLYLYDNRIRRIEPGALDGMIRLEQIRIDKNEIHCDCSIQTAVKYLSSLRERPQVRCKSPKKMSGRIIYNAMQLLRLGFEYFLIMSNYSTVSTTMR